MGSQRAHIVLPQDLIAEIDAIVGPRGRSAFLVETARAELRKRQLLTFLRSDEPVWRDEDHPELAEGTHAWVRKLRQENEVRMTAFDSATALEHSLTLMTDNVKDFPHPDLSLYPPTLAPPEPPPA